MLSPQQHRTLTTSHQLHFSRILDHNITLQTTVLSQQHLSPCPHDTQVIVMYPLDGMELEKWLGLASLCLIFQIRPYPSSVVVWWVWWLVRQWWRIWRCRQIGTTIASFGARGGWIQPPLDAGSWCRASVVLLAFLGVLQCWWGDAFVGFVCSLDWTNGG